MALYTRLESRTPTDPVLVVHLEGWIDAGLGGATAMATLIEAAPTEPVAVFDSDELIDYRARRPVLRIVDGVAESLTWREPQLLLSTDGAGRDMLLLVGPEPDTRWRAFAADVVGLASGLGVRMVVGLGAFPAAVPHTRPIRIAATAQDEATATRVGFVTGSIDVPGGMHSVLEKAFSEIGVSGVGLWARVPHYLSGLAFPGASAALLTALGSIAGLTLDTAELDAAGDLALQRIDKLVEGSEEHKAMIRQLEQSVDAAEGTPLDIGQVPTADELAAELERFLRGDRG